MDTGEDVRVKDTKNCKKHSLFASLTRLVFSGCSLIVELKNDCDMKNHK
ncbi:hypothetical protein [Facklamia sp. 7083-14-GEN3]|nr:hypothetical protein [Facklamia sp. 7083-14-GEN3]MCR8968412.1 hypothetical protein [Facklamia sp. 7083-14-GEN3]